MLSLSSFSKPETEKGQGLVEYALILTLVAVVVIASLFVLGPTVRNIFSRVVNGLGGSGAITGVTATRTGNGNGNSVDVNINVSTNTTVTVSDSQNASSVTATCNGSCTINLSGVGNNAGTVTVTATAGGVMTANYIPKN